MAYTGRLKEEPGPELEHQAYKPGREHGPDPEVLDSHGKDRLIFQKEQQEEEKGEVGKPGKGGAELEVSPSENRANSLIKQMDKTW